MEKKSIFNFLGLEPFSKKEFYESLLISDALSLGHRCFLYC
jgi:hypothetical protein